MKIKIELTPDELASLVGGVMEYNGYRPTIVEVRLGDELINYDRIVVEAEPVAPLEVRTVREEPLASHIDQMRSLLYPQVPSKVTDGKG